MKEWFIFSKRLSCCLVFILFLVSFFDHAYVIYIFSVLSMTIFISSITALFLISIKKDCLNQIILHAYFDIRRVVMKFTDGVYSSSLPPNLISENERKMSARLRKVRECIMFNYVTSWWSYISPTHQFEVKVRMCLSHALELVIARFSFVPYSQMIMIAIRLKVGLKRAGSSASIRRIADVDPEKYFASALFEILPLVLNEKESNILALRELLANMISSSVAMPLLDLVQSPHIIFNAVIALLVRDQNDIATYVTQVQQQRNLSKMGIAQDQPSFLSHTINHALSSKSIKDGICEPSFKSGSLCDSGHTDLFHTVSDIQISDTFRSTDAKSGNQFTMYIIKFSHTVSNSRGSLSKQVAIVHRRYKEFINLHHLLTDMPDYKGIRGPSSLDQMFLHNFSSARINVRRDFLENYLRCMVERQALVNSDTMHRFLGLCKFSASQPFEHISKPLNAKLKKKWNDLIDKLSDRQPDHGRELHSDKEDDSLSEKDDMKNNNETNDPRDEIKKVLTSLPKVSCHQNPAFPYQVPEFEYQHPLIQSNFHHLTDNYNAACQQTSVATPIQIAPNDSHMPVSYSSSPFLYGASDPVPFLLSFRLLALQYRDSTCRNWRPHEGPVLTRTGGWLSKWQKLFWQVLGCAADPIIQWSFEELLRASFVADYMELFQELLWPSGKSTKSLATFAMDVDIAHLRQATSQSIADAIPKVAYLFVKKDELVDLVDAVLSDFQDAQSNRLFFFQIFQILIEEHLFRDVFKAANHQS